MRRRRIIEIAALALSVGSLCLGQTGVSVAPWFAGERRPPRFPGGYFRMLAAGA